MNGFDKHLVPQMPPGQSRRPGLTSSQHSELEAARRRAEKAAEGKRANATAAARRAKRRAANASRAAEREDSGGPSESQAASQDEDRQPQATPLKDDEKEAKRLKRWAYHMGIMAPPPTLSCCVHDGQDIRMHILVLSWSNLLDITFSCCHMWQQGFIAAQQIHEKEHAGHASQVLSLALLGKVSTSSLSTSQGWQNEA